MFPFTGFSIHIFGKKFITNGTNKFIKNSSKGIRNRQANDFGIVILIKAFRKAIFKFLVDYRNKVVLAAGRVDIKALKQVKRSL